MIFEKWGGGGWWWDDAPNPSPPSLRPKGDEVLNY